MSVMSPDSINMFGRNSRIVAAKLATLAEFVGAWIPRFDWFGLYPTTQTIVAQSIVLVAFAAIAVWSLRGKRSD